MNEKYDVLYFIRKQIEKENKKVEVSVSKDGKTHIHSISGVMYVKVSPEDYSRVTEEVRKIEMEKELEAKREQREFDEYVETATRILETNRSKGNRIQNTVNMVGKTVPQKGMVYAYPSSNRVQKPANKPISKKTISGKKKLGLKSRFKLAGLSILLAGGIVIGYTAAQIPDYKEKAFTDSLNAVKVELSENLNIPVEQITIRNDSTLLSSNSAITDYSIRAGSKTYKYIVDIQGGEFIIREDSIKDENVKNAIAIVSSAQNGDIFEAMRANKLKKDIESEKINFNIPVRENDSKEIEEDER